MSMKTTLVVLITSTLLASACGVRRDLKPALGRNLPPAPYGRTTAPMAADLLSPSTQSQPARNVELRTKSEPRTDDPFDLPPHE